MTVVLLVLGLAVLTLVAGGKYLYEREGLFDPQHLHSLAKRCVEAGYDADTAFANITAELQRLYPAHIVGNNPFLFINCGQWMGSFKLLHASLSEYILFFGTPMGTSGHSGRYIGTVYDFLLTGHVC